MTEGRIPVVTYVRMNGPEVLPAFTPEEKKIIEKENV